MQPSAQDVRALYRGTRRVRFVDVPELTYLALPGGGEPNGVDLAEAAGMLVAVSRAAAFVVRRRTGSAPRMLPLEVLWENEPPAAVDLVAALALGMAGLNAVRRGERRWQAMIAQPPTVDAATFEQAVSLARKGDLARADEVRLLRWAEGPAAQLLHLGLPDDVGGVGRRPVGDTGPAAAALREAVAAAGLRPAGRWHEIHLTDPWRTPAQRRRTLLRQPVEPATRGS